MSKNYVLGLVLDKKIEKTILLRKNRPSYQSGKLNGVGGKIEEKESPIESMIRETSEEVFFKEKPFKTKKEDWIFLSEYFFEGGKIYIFYLITELDLSLFSKGEDQEIELHEINKLNEFECLDPIIEIINLIKSK